MAARRERGLLDPNAKPGESIFDHDIFVFASDGDLEEGVSGEASSIAGHQQLGNLVLLYDNNQISIEDDTSIAFSEDVSKRYEAYGWHVQNVDWTNGGQGYEENVRALFDAYKAAKAETRRPSFINLRTIIAWPAPNAQNTGKAHGSALGAEEVAATQGTARLRPRAAFRCRGRRPHPHRRGGRARQSHPVGVAERYDAWAAEAEERVGLDGCAPAPCRTDGQTAADVRPGREGHGHPQGIRGGVGCHRPAPP